MKNIKSFQNHLNKINDSGFDNHAIALFKFQAKGNPVYAAYLDYLNINPEKVENITQVPFLPIEFFKSHTVKTGVWEPEVVFESSGTTQLITSKHYIQNLHFYNQHAVSLFTASFGPLENKVIYALLPSYLERQGSSLVNMVDTFIKATNNPASGFYLNEVDELIAQLTHRPAGKEVFLFGVTFALLDLAERFTADLSHVTIIETGGMKGRREEIIKDELYEILRNRLKIRKIYSEYGMTELISQTYGPLGRFPQSTAMKIFIRDINDPFTLLEPGKTGGINIIDLANVHSCAFIETKDLGRINNDGSFEVLGRFDNADLRGCNLLVN